MRTDKRTDMTKLIVAFLDFANAPKKTTCKKKSIILFDSYPLPLPLGPFIVQQRVTVPCIYVCRIWLPQDMPINSLHISNWLVFVTKLKYQI
jgi:hypothetical protein